MFFAWFARFHCSYTLLKCIGGRVYAAWHGATFAHDALYGALGGSCIGCAIKNLWRCKSWRRMHCWGGELQSGVPALLGKLLCFKS